jgi:aquaporin TIP
VSTRADAAERRRDDPLTEWVFPLIAEAIGTFALVFFGVGTVVATGGQDLVTIGLAFGLAIAVMVGAAGHISGGAFNPAVTIGLVIGSKLAPAKAAGYIVAQLVGATLAALAVKAVFPEILTDAVALGTPAVGDGFSERNALIAEMITTFFLMYVIYGVAVDKRGPAAIVALLIGLTIAIGIFVTAGVSGGALNPARWFGPALVQGEWESAWIWIVGPVLGAAIAAVVYHFGYHQGRDGTIEPVLRED